MSFRARLFLALVLAALLPLSALAFGVRREMTRRLTAENARRGDAAVTTLRDDLASESAAVAARLATLTAELGRDNGLRLALVQGNAARRGLLDLAGSSMRSSGLAMLQLQDSAGRILSSGHFRNAYDRLEPALPRALMAAGAAPVLVRARTADATLLVLARLDSVRVAGAGYTVIGGTAIEPVKPGVLDVGDEHGKRVPCGVLQASETFIGGEGSATTLQHEKKGRHEEQAERQRDHELRQIESAGAQRAAHASARHRRLRQNLQRDTVGAGVIARIGPAQRDEVAGRCGGAGGGREFHAGVRGVREEGACRGLEVGEVRGREPCDVAAARLLA